MDTIEAIKVFWRATKGNWIIRIVAIVWATALGIAITVMLIAAGIIAAALLGYSPDQHATPNAAYHGPRHEGRAPRSVDDAFLFGPTPQPGNPQP